MTEPEVVQRAKIGARIREARKMAGLSQGQAARLLDMHRPTVSEIEAGNRRVSGDELAKMAEIFDVSVAWLVGASPETLSADNPRLQLAARELGKLKPEDLDRVLRLLAAMRGPANENET
jgi:transcriptional regulator with XRE-family HTH domain